MLDLLLLLLSLCRPARLLSWALCLAGVLALWLAVEKATLRDYIKARARYNSYYEQVQRLQRQQQTYKNELADIKAGGFRLEKTIREECPLIRPGEKIVYIEMPEDANAASTRPQSLDSGVVLEKAPEPATELRKTKKNSSKLETAPAETDLPAAGGVDAAETPTPKKKARNAAVTTEAQPAPGAATGTATATKSKRATKKAGSSEGTATRRTGKRAGKAAAQAPAGTAKVQANSPAAEPATRAPRLSEF